MKTGEAKFRFPVLGFTADKEIWGFEDLDRLTKCGPRTLKDGIQLGMELVDGDGQRWVVRSVWRTGRAGSLLSLLLIFGPPQSRIEHELEIVAPLSIEEVRRRACEAMETHSINYLEGDDPDIEFRPLLAKVRKARSVEEIYDLLQPDTFEPH
jgi:hypothetical protein